METLKILLLWAPLADYTVACLKELAKKQDIELYLIYQPTNIDAPYSTFDLTFCNKVIVYTKVREREIFDFCMNINPDYIFMSSWNYSFYMDISKKCKQNGTYVISMFDGQWMGTLKQRLGIAISSFYLKPCIDNFFVPGDRQAYFARKLGFKNPLQGYYSANSNRFQSFLKKDINKFIFVGRLISIKGIENLLKAYKIYRNSVDHPWGLIICGTGSLKYLCENQEGVELMGFMQPERLPFLFSEAKCLILPSLFEPWGVVIHEAALSGLLIIASYASGASTYFVRDGQNGYIINPDEVSLSHAMILITNSSDEKIDEMSSVSKTLGMLWTTEKWANYVYQNIRTKRKCI